LFKTDNNNRCFARNLPHEFLPYLEQNLVTHLSQQNCCIQKLLCNLKHALQTIHFYSQGLVFHDNWTKGSEHTTTVTRCMHFLTYLLPCVCTYIKDNHAVHTVIYWYSIFVRLRLKCDGTCAETRFRLSAKWMSPFQSMGTSVQSTTGSRGVRISGSNARYTMFWGSVKGTGYPLHLPVAPSLPLPCVTVCHHISTGLYIRESRVPAYLQITVKFFC
jgi:hypothetical protein